MAKISMETIMECCNNGIKESFNEYYNWSIEQQWLWNAPEYLITVNIAKQLAKQGLKITLEDNVRYLLEKADAYIKGKLADKIRADGRSDIVVWWKDNTPRGIIEVKNAVYHYKDIEIDINRIEGILDKHSTFQFGITTFYIDRHFETGNSIEKIESKIDDIIENIKSKYNKYFYKSLSKKIKSQDEDTSYAVTILFKKA